MGAGKEGKLSLSRIDIEWQSLFPTELGETVTSLGIGFLSLENNPSSFLIRGYFREN